MAEGERKKREGEGASRGEGVVWKGRIHILQLGEAKKFPWKQAKAQEKRKESGKEPGESQVKEV